MENIQENVIRFKGFKVYSNVIIHIIITFSDISEKCQNNAVIQFYHSNLIMYDYAYEMSNLWSNFFHENHIYICI